MSDLGAAGVTNIATRIAAIEQRIGALGGRTTSASGADFAAVLASATEPSQGYAAMQAPGGVSGASVVADAQQYLGVPYRWGGTDPSTGLDCSGLVQRVYADLDVTLPRVAADQARQGTAVASLSEAQPGDLVTYGSPADHIGIYVGNGMMIDAAHSGTAVRMDPVGNPTSIRRILSADATTSLATDPTTLLGAYAINSLGTGALGSLGTGALGSLGTDTTGSLGTDATGSLGTDAIGSLGADPTASLGAAISPSVQQYAPLFSAAAARYGIPANVLAAVAQVESGGDRTAVSPAGAEGLMQLMPQTAGGLGVDPMNPSQAVDGAARTLAQDLQQFHSLPLALAAYNAGAGAVERAGGIPPYAETQAYVRNVLAAAGGGA